MNENKKCIFGRDSNFSKTTLQSLRGGKSITPIPCLKKLRRLYLNTKEKCLEPDYRNSIETNIIYIFIC